MNTDVAEEQKMRVLVAYHTQTGNTEKVARAIQAEAQAMGHEADLEKVRRTKPQTLGDYDLVFLGAPCHHSDLPKAAKKLLTTLPSQPSPRLAGFVTHATCLPEGGDRQRQLYNEWAGKCAPSFEEACKESGISFAGFFSCQGAPSKPIELFIHRAIFKDRDEWMQYIAETRKHPTEKDLENARAFAREIIAQVS
jgi:flavodoxin I